MELINYSLTFYIYCLFSEDFRNTLFRTIRWPWFEKPLYNRGTEVSRSKNNSLPNSLTSNSSVPPKTPRIRIDPERPPAPPPPIERKAPTREWFLPGQRLPPAPLLEPAQSAPVAGVRLWWRRRPPPPPAPAPSDGHSDDDDDDGHGQQHAPTSAPSASHVDSCDHDDDDDHLRRIVVRVLYRGVEHQREIVEHLTHQPVRECFQWRWGTSGWERRRVGYGFRRRVFGGWGGTEAG